MQSDDGGQEVTSVRAGRRQLLSVVSVGCGVEVSRPAPPRHAEARYDMEAPCALPAALGLSSAAIT